MTTKLTCSPSPDQSSALITRCHPTKHARCGLICANVDGITRRRKRLSGIRCRIENCVQSFTAVNLNHVPPDRHVGLCWCSGWRLIPPKVLEPCRRQFRISNRVSVAARETGGLSRVGRWSHNPTEQLKLADFVAPKGDPDLGGRYADTGGLRHVRRLT